MTCQCKRHPIFGHEDGCDYEGTGAMTVWAHYRKCPICAAATGVACESLSGLVVGGRPDKVSVVLAIPHRARKMRVGYGRG